MSGDLSTGRVQDTREPVRMSRMTSTDLSIPGVAGEILIEYGSLGGHKFTVGGEPVRPHGFPRNKLTLPGTDGPVEAKVKGGLFRAHPALLVGGKEYAAGPPTPRVLQILALLPLAALLLVQGALGFLVAFGGIAVNMGVVRSERSDGVKVGLVVATFIVAVVIDLAIAVALTSAFGR